jgi:pilus assembly protein CpaE
MGYDLNRVRLVLNRADSRVGLDANDVEAIVGGAPDVLVPSHRDVTRTVNEAKLIVTSSPRSEAARAFKKLARMYEPVAQANGNGTAGRRRLRRKGR